jgi:hypothetical protein
VSRGNRLKIFVVIVLLFGAFASIGRSASSNGASIVGIVTGLFDRPIRSASVSLRGALNGAPLVSRMSDSNGRFSFRHVAPGMYFVVATKGRWCRKTRAFTIADGDAKILRLHMVYQSCIGPGDKVEFAS